MRITPTRLLTRFGDCGDRNAGIGMRRYIWNSGRMMTCCGSRLPAVNSTSNGRLNRNEYRLTTNATKLASSSVRISDGTTMRNVTQ